MLKMKKRWLEEGDPVIYFMQMGPLYGTIVTIDGRSALVIDSVGARHNILLKDLVYNETASKVA